MPSHSRSALAAAIVVAPLLFGGCASDRPAAEPVEVSVDAAACVETAVYGASDDLFGWKWLRDYKADPSDPDVSLVRCHYVHDPNRDGDRSVPDASWNAMSGDLVPPPTVVGDGTEVQTILLALPDATDPMLWRCPSTEVADFDVFQVRDGSGTPVAAFQTSQGGACGRFRVVPTD